MGTATPQIDSSLPARHPQHEEASPESQTHGQDEGESAKGFASARRLLPTTYRKPNLIGPAGVMCQSFNQSLGSEECQMQIGCRPRSQDAFLELEVSWAAA